MWAALPVLISAVAYITYEKARPMGLRYSIALAIGVLIAQSLLIEIARVVLSQRHLGLLGFSDTFRRDFVFLTTSSLIIICSYRVMFALVGKRPFLIPYAVVSMLLIASVYLVIFAFGLYLAIPVPLGGGNERVFAMVVDNAKVRRAVTGEETTETRFVTDVLAETASEYIIRAPSTVPYRAWVIALEESNPDRKEWHARKASGPSYVLLPKKEVSVVTVIGVSREPGLRYVPEKQAFIEALDEVERSTEERKRRDKPSPTPESSP